MLQIWVMVADVVSPLHEATRTTTRTLTWMVPVALVFIIIAIVRRRKRTRP